MKKFNVKQLIILGKKLKVDQNGKINIDCFAYASTGYCRNLEPYRHDLGFFIEVIVQFDFNTQKGTIYSPWMDKPKEQNVLLWRKKNRIYLGLVTHNNSPIIIEIRLDSVWVRIFCLRESDTLIDLAEELFIADNEFSPLAQQAIMRLNSAIALGDVELDYVKPGIY